MREEGMSNRAIGEALGLSHVTIHRYLGPQGPGIRREYGAGKKPKPYSEPAPETAKEVPACLAVVDREVILQGIVGQYCISPKHKKMEMVLASGLNTEMDFDKVRQFADELNAIVRKLDGLIIENEMW